MPAKDGGEEESRKVQAFHIQAGDYPLRQRTAIKGTPTKEKTKGRPARDPVKPLQVSETSKEGVSNGLNITNEKLCRTKVWGGALWLERFIVFHIG